MRDPTHVLKLAGPKGFAAKANDNAPEQRGANDDALTLQPSVPLDVPTAPVQLWGLQGSGATVAGSDEPQATRVLRHC